MDGPIYTKTVEFSIDLIALYKALRTNREYIVSSQLLRAGTSIGANVHEATSAQSRKDFIHKMSIAAKEAKETRYWLIIISNGKLVDYDTSKLISDLDEIIKILSKIIITSKTKMG